MKKLAIALAAFSVLGTAVSSEAALVHRYEFNNGAIDSVGTANGTLLANGSIAGGKLTTAATATATTGVSLPATAVAGITNSFTIETYFDNNVFPAGDFKTLFAFSDGTSANFIAAVPVRNGPNFNSSVALRTTPPGGGELQLLGPPLDGGGDNFIRQFAFTFDKSTGNVAFVVNGAVQATGNYPSLNLSALNALIGIAGGAPFGDLSLNGDTFDFRIYDQALTTTQLLALSNLGSDASTVAIQAVAVPEPTSLGLLGLGAVGLLGRRRKA